MRAAGIGCGACRTPPFRIAGDFRAHVTDESTITMTWNSSGGGGGGSSSSSPVKDAVAGANLRGQA